MPQKKAQCGVCGAPMDPRCRTCRSCFLDACPRCGKLKFRDRALCRRCAKLRSCVSCGERCSVNASLCWGCYLRLPRGPQEHEKRCVRAARSADAVRAARVREFARRAELRLPLFQGADSASAGKLR